MTITEKVELEDFDHIAANNQRSLRFPEAAVHEGDTIILEEWDAQTQMNTGRKIETIVAAVQALPTAAEWGAQAMKSNSR